jgi:hypothetical protein
MAARRNGFAWRITALQRMRMRRMRLLPFFPPVYMAILLILDEMAAV